MRKKIITSIIAVTFFLSGFYDSFSYIINKLSSADISSITTIYAQNSSSFTYAENEDGTISITGYNTDVPSELVIPSEIDTKKVTAIGFSAFSNLTNITKVIIPEGISDIGEQAFLGCSSLEEIALPSTIKSLKQNVLCSTALKSITIPEGVEKIEGYAFQNCSSLETVNLPSTITVIEDYSFIGCKSLKSINIDDSNQNYSSIDGALVDTSNARLILVPNISGAYTVPDSICSIANNVFSDMTDLTDVTMSDNVTEIGDYAFNNCTSLTSVKLSNSLSSISSGLFYGCASLSEITLPENIEGINYYAFSYTGIKSITIPKNVDYIYSAFDNMSNLESINVSEDNEVYYSIDGVLFEHNVYSYDPSVKLILYPQNKKETSYIVPDGTNTIYDCAFSETSVVNVTLPDSVTSINSSAFSDTASLESIQMTDNVKSIGSYAFMRSGLKSIVLPQKITELQAYTFYRCTNLESVTVPPSVVNISDISVFGECPNLKISGYENTAIQEYATKNYIPFISLGEIPTKKIRVETSEEFLNAIGSYTEITLADGVYEFIEGIDSYHSAININTVNNLTIKAENSGKAEFLLYDGFTPAIEINSSKNILIEGVIIGHKAIRYDWGCGDTQYSSGYVIKAYKSENITINNCDLYGCGTVAADLYQVKGFSANNCILRDCKENIANVYYSSGDIIFNECVISGNAYDPSYAESKSAISYTYNTEDCIVKFNSCKFFNNHNKTFTNNTQKVIADENCIFSDNAWDGETPKQYGVCLNNITWALEQENGKNILKLGYPIILSDETEYLGEGGEILPYSVYSVPWKGLNIDEYILSDSVKFDPENIIDPDKCPGIICEISDFIATYTQDNSLELSANISSTKITDSVIYAAAYDEHEQLLNTMTIIKHINSGDNSISYTMDNVPENTAKIKLFAFYKKDGISPIANSAEIILK